MRVHVSNLRFCSVLRPISKCSPHADQCRRGRSTASNSAARLLDLSPNVALKTASARLMPSRRGSWTVPFAAEGENNVVVEGSAEDGNPSQLKMVLVHPQIPGNTGTVARTCAATGVPLHLVGPLGFDIDDKAVKRAGLDYWPYVFVKCHDSWDDFFQYFQEQEEPKRLVGFSKKGAAVHTEDGAYLPGDWLLFGSEVSGLPDGAWEQCRSLESHGGGIRLIPIIEKHVRSLNLAVSAGIGLYEAQRQAEIIIAQHERK
eukprot:CAMPEP_0114230444 /NCGR_PEP_ID=MMETSP0058-20121206/3476_1 /TAXON_ID=36894 /ORGANISM="Pyramimonas parkeae, CCMP726" /LENGTH=258 /DNA_ID=CAMNT_0001341651 /DNA_START=44 /DNA_END=820 /DNA_ORIENTATION=+